MAVWWLTMINTLTLPTRAWVPDFTISWDVILSLHARNMRNTSVSSETIITDWKPYSPAWVAWASYQILKIAGCACAGNAGNVFPATAGKRSRHTWRTCRDACRDHWLAVSFEIGGGGKRSRHSRACATRNFTYLVRGPCRSKWVSASSWPDSRFRHRLNPFVVIS